MKKTIIKFLLVGVVNTAVGAGVMFVLFNAARVDYWISSACNYILGGMLSYFLNKYFTFENYEKSIAQVLLFILNLVVCYMLAYFLSKKIVCFILSSQDETMRGNISLLVGMCLYTVLNYFGQRFIFSIPKESVRE